MVEVVVSYDQIEGARAYPERYLNTSILHAPPLSLADRVVSEYGKPRIVRCWLTLHHIWNPESDAYDYNFKVPRRVYEDDFRPGIPDGTKLTNRLVEYENFEDYIAAFSRNSDEILLNIRDFEKEVLSGKIELTKWTQVFENAVRHYKKRYPNIRYIEVLNEYDIGEKTAGVAIDAKQYYGFYRAAYQAINRVNAELRPQVRLLVGGPCTSRWNREEIDLFIELYANDPDPEKALEFLSFHDYHSDRTPAIYEQFEDEYRKRFAQLRLPTDIPIFLTEVGCGGGEASPDPERNLAQATGLTSYQYYARKSPLVKVFPWVLFHSRQQACFAQFTQDRVMTPSGAAVKIWSLHKRDEIAASVRRIAQQSEVYAYATRDDNAIAIQAWRFEPYVKGAKDAEKPTQAIRVNIAGLPETWEGRQVRVSQYLVDSTHSNCYAIAGKGALTQIGSWVTSTEALGQLAVKLEANAIGFWLIERE